MAIRVARKVGWTGRVVSQEPPYETSLAYGLLAVPTTVLVDRAGVVAGSVVGWDQPAISAVIEEARTLLGTAALELPPPAEPLRKPGCSSKAAMDPEVAAAISRPAAEDEMEEMFERGWTDGLPVVPPTQARVEAMLGRRRRFCLLGEVPPAMGEATLERVAACAVLAGCRPEYFPVVVAAVKGHARSRLQPARPGGDDPAGRPARHRQRPGRRPVGAQQRDGRARTRPAREPDHRPRGTADRHPDRRRHARARWTARRSGTRASRLLHRRGRGRPARGSRCTWSAASIQASPS